MYANNRLQPYDAKNKYLSVIKLPSGIILETIAMEAKNQNIQNVTIGNLLYKKIAAATAPIMTAAENKKDKSVIF